MLLINNFTQWKNSKNLWVYDFSPNMCNSFHTHVAESGYINLDLSFTEELKNTLVLLVYGVFDTNVYINKERYPVVDKDQTVE